MSYDNTLEYNIIPTETFKIIRGCAGCGCKQVFSCRNNFRVNANGSRLDVWLIYSCDKCGHTYNLPVYERISPSKIPDEEYNKYLSNDIDKIFETGTNKAIFVKNKVEITWKETKYEIVPVTNSDYENTGDKLLINLHNRCDVPVRTDKIAADILKMTRSEIKRLLSENKLSVCVLKN